jgi:hypothetical protein
MHGDEDRALIADGKVVDDFQLRRQAAGRGADSDEQVWILGAHEARGVQTLNPWRHWRSAEFERGERGRWFGSTRRQVSKRTNDYGAGLVNLSCHPGVLRECQLGDTGRFVLSAQRSR